MVHITERCAFYIIVGHKKAKTPQRGLDFCDAQRVNKFARVHLDSNENTLGRVLACISRLPILDKFRTLDWTKIRMELESMKAAFV